MPDKGACPLPLPDIPGDQGSIIGSGNDKFRIVCPGQVGDAGLVALEGVFEYTRSGVPQFNSGIIG